MLSSKYLDIGEAIQYFTLHSLYWAHCRRQCRCRHQMVIAVASSNDEVIAASNGRPNFLLKTSIFDQNVKKSATFWEHYFFFQLIEAEFLITMNSKSLSIIGCWNQILENWKYCHPKFVKKYSNYSGILWYCIAVCRQQWVSDCRMPATIQKHDNMPSIRTYLAL